MLRLFIVTFLFVSAHCCAPTVINTGLTYIGRFVLCTAVIQPFRAVSNSTISTCINAQTGLMATIESLRDPASAWEGHLIAWLLEKNGRATEATALRKCFARENGMLNADDTYNMDKLKTDILSKIGNNECLANTKVGFQQCRAMVNYDVDIYLQCVIGFCAQGVSTTG